MVSLEQLTVWLHVGMHVIICEIKLSFAGVQHTT